MPRLVEARTKPAKIGVAQGLTYPRGDIHYVVIVLGVVTDGREAEAAISIEKPIPRGVAGAALELDHPSVHGRLSVRSGGYIPGRCPPQPDDPAPVGRRAGILYDTEAAYGIGARCADAGRFSSKYRVNSEYRCCRVVPPEIE